MKRDSWLGGALIGALTALPVIGLMLLGDRLAQLPFLPFDLFDWLARVLPGWLIVPSIGLMVRVITVLHVGPTASSAKAAEHSLAILIFIVGGGLFGAILAGVTGQRPGTAARTGTIEGFILSAAAIAVEASLGFSAADAVNSSVWIVIVLTLWGWALGRLLQALPAPESAGPAPRLSRRQFLTVVGGGAAATTLGALGLSNWLRRSPPPPPAAPQPIDTSGTTGAAASPPQPTLAARITPAPGTRPEVTANPDFYRIDIDSIPPQVDGASWKLELGGLVDHPMSLTLDQLRSRPAFTQFVTMQCISNPVGGDLTGTSRWTGLRFKDLLADAGLQASAIGIAIRSVDGFYETVSRADAADDRTLLVYEMNGEPLPPDHGFPLRIYIPDRYGMKQPKWITHMEAVDQAQLGYWVERGWSQEARPETVSVIDAVALDAQSGTPATAPVGGIAWAGARGISRVEVQVDDGPWTAVELRVPPLSPLTWVEWRYDWPFQAGRHTFRVRAYDAKGEPQVAGVSDPFPSGATGYHSLTVSA